MFATDVSTTCVHGSHLQSQVLVLVSSKFKNPGEWFDWSIYRVAVSKCFM